MTKKFEIRFAIAFSLFVSTIGIANAQTRWVGSWAASQQLVEPQNAFATDSSHGVTLRQIVHLSLGGTTLRLHLSNRFGAAALHFTAVHIASSVATDSPKIISGTDKTLTFSGQPDVTVPAGADYVSDPLEFQVAALSDLAITLHIDAVPEQQTGHPGSRATSYVAQGDVAPALDLPGARRFDHWYFISGVDVSAPANYSRPFVSASVPLRRQPPSKRKNSGPNALTHAIGLACVSAFD
jgi:hypothetical protein